jgi:hypothetical protein
MLDIKSQYLAFELSPVSRTFLLTQFSPHFKKVMCQHITVMFNLTDESAALLQEQLANADLRVVGFQTGDGVECLVVEVNGSSRRPDGGCYHITLSLADGHKPVESNMLIKQQGFQTCVPVQIEAELKLLNK